MFSRTDLLLFDFLEQYLLRLEGPLAAQVWVRFIQLAKDLSAAFRDYKPQVFSTLRSVPFDKERRIYVYSLNIIGASLSSQTKSHKPHWLKISVFVKTCRYDKLWRQNNMNLISILSGNILETSGPLFARWKRLRAKLDQA